MCDSVTSAFTYDWNDECEMNEYNNYHDYE